MSRHHPKNTTLAEFAAGTLDEGRSLVVASHLAMCGNCREYIAALEEAGGQMLAEIDPVAMAPGAALHALALLDREANSSRGQTRNRNEKRTIVPVWQPEQKHLLGYELGPWRWVAPGLHHRVVKVPSEGGARVFMLKAAPGLRIPEHSHTGTELTCVLSGAFIHEGGRYAAGDCDDADHDDGHSPVIDGDEECICLVAMQGELKLSGLIGRMMQPFVRI
ncbi:ChrR family anti-sigma-E factor [Undibacter mobilis]|uniref:Anti-sigma factor n=1 Tax=Undibacter mobilis TaxID=2292256 RepID=A0A371B7P0_9BRAD|nr:ChrR family anti-sigma-E factor [Undibacter mobilis]RDV03590.1 anti-sigma factor [Undibacter mobilis]